jgi:hypothetical protein
MVTNWNNHWDNLKDNSTYFTNGMLKGNMKKSNLKDNTTTIFIKRNKDTRKFEKTWIGRVNNFREGYDRKNRNCIYFTVEIDNIIQCPEEYMGRSEGWYLETEGLNRDISIENKFDPQFFKELMATNNWQIFEEYTYYLIKCLGIHTSCRFGFKEQKGKADGFFKFGNLAVLYDCTLDSNYENSKDIQIKNFCNQLKESTIDYNHKKINIINCNKNVWIITRNRESKLIMLFDEINIKEISIEKIIEVYRKRIIENLDDRELEQELRKL